MTVTLGFIGPVIKVIADYSIPIIVGVDLLIVCRLQPEISPRDDATCRVRRSSHDRWQRVGGTLGYLLTIPPAARS